MPGHRTVTSRRLFVLATAVIGVALGVALGVIGSFLVPFRIGATLVPVSIVVAVLGNVVAGFLLGYAAQSRLVAALPALGWVVVVLLFASPRAEGDVIVTGGAVGAAFLVSGAIAAGVPIVLRKP